MSRQIRSSDGRQAPPHILVELVEWSRRGVVFRSDRPFEVGDSFRLGLHVKRAGRSRFIDAEGWVVACRRLCRASFPVVYEITLAFASLADEDGEFLRPARPPLHPLAKAPAAAGNSAWDSYCGRN